MIGNTIDLIVRTIYDGRDLRSVDEIFYYDDDGEEVIHKEATNACIGVNTCADMGEEAYQVLSERITDILNSKGIMFSDISFEDQF